MISSAKRIAILVVSGVSQLILLGLSYIVPRNSRLMVYADNNLNSSIYLFRYACRQKDGYTHVYITPYDEVAKTLKAEGLKVAQHSSIYAYFLAFRAKTYVVSSSKGQVNNLLSRHANIVNLWHGISVKKIGLLNSRSFLTLDEKRKEYTLSLIHI